MYLFGASGHGKVVIEVFRSFSETIEIEGIYDDNPLMDNMMGISVTRYDKGKLLPAGPWLISIGNNYFRKKVTRKIGADYISAIHPTAVLSESAIIDEGTVVMANAVINSEAKVGKHCIINTGSIVEHDCKLDDFVHISPQAALAGAVEIGEGAHIGISACVIQGVKIGKWSTIGAGAVVIQDVPDFAVVVGNPARIIKYNSF